MCHEVRGHEEQVLHAFPGQGTRRGLGVRELGGLGAGDGGLGFRDLRVQGFGGWGYGRRGILVRVRGQGRRPMLCSGVRESRGFGGLGVRVYGVRGLLVRVRGRGGGQASRYVGDRELRGFGG